MNTNDYTVSITVVDDTYAVQIVDNDTDAILAEANDLFTMDEALDFVRRFTA